MAKEQINSDSEMSADPANSLEKLKEAIREREKCVYKAPDECEFCDIPGHWVAPVRNQTQHWISSSRLIKNFELHNWGQGTRTSE